MADFTSLFMPESASPEEQALARAQALRQQAQASPQGIGQATPQEQEQNSGLHRQGAMGLLGMLTGDPVLSHFGNAAMGNAERQEEQLRQAPQQRLKMALEGLELQKTQKEQQELADPSSPRNSMARNLGNQLGMKVEPGARYDQLSALLPLAQQAYHVRTMASAMRDKSGGGMVANSLTPESLDQFAVQYHTTGQLPAMGMGVAGAALKAKIANRAAEMFGDANLAENKASFGANTASLKKLQTQADAIDAFENTALKNLDLFLGQARKVVDTGSPLFNAPARVFSQKVAGNPEMAAFNTARQTAVQEISKVLSGSMGNNAVSDSARHEVESLISPDASLAQIERAAQILKADMANRRSAVQGQLSEIHGRISGRKAAPEAVQGPDSHAAARQWAKDHPNDPRAAKILQVNKVLP